MTYLEKNFCQTTFKKKNVKQKLRHQVVEAKAMRVEAIDNLRFHIHGFNLTYLQSDSRVYRGHSSHVTSVGFLSDNQKILTTGGQDCSVMQWQIV